MTHPEALRVVKEFSEGTIKWFMSFPVIKREIPCSMCGIIPGKMYELSDALKKLGL